MQREYPIYSRHPRIPVLCALFALLALSPTFAAADAVEGDVVTQYQMASWRTLPVAGPVAGHAPDANSVVFDATRGDRQLCLVDLDQATLPATVIDFSVDRAQPLRLEVYDLEGQHVRTLADGLWAPGNHRMAWHHETESGQLLEAGTYMVRMETAMAPAAGMTRAR